MDSFESSFAQLDSVGRLKALDDLTLTKLKELSVDEARFANFMNTLGDDELSLLDRKLNPSGVNFKPGQAANYAIVSANNMRVTSTFQMLLMGMIAYLYRAADERATEEFTRQTLDEPYTKDEIRAIKRFLGELFEYNPKEHIDRLTSEEFTHQESKTKTMKVRTEGKKTRPSVVDVSKRASRERAQNQVEKAVATMEFNDGKTVRVDPPLDFYGKFMTFYNLHYDGIRKTAFELFLEQRINAHCGKIDEPDSVVEEVKTLVAYQGKEKVISQFRLPHPNLQWNLSLIVYSPENGQFYTTPQAAEADMLKLQDKTVADISIVPTNATVQLASFAKERRSRIEVGDAYAKAIFKNQEDAQKVYSRLNKKRVQKAALVNMIERGPHAENFKNYLSARSNGVGQDAGLNEFEEEELMELYRDYLNENLIYSDDDSTFYEFVKIQLPGRDLTRKPLTIKERREMSKKYNNTLHMPEVTDDEMIGIDMYELGEGGLDHRRVYAEAPETIVGKN